MADHWAVLGIAPTDDRRDIKRAYGRALKAIDVDADPAAFVRLREAMDAALEWGTATPWWDEDEEWYEETAEEPGVDTLVEAEDELADTDDDLPLWDEDWRSYRPVAPAVGEGRLGRLCAELEDFLFGKERPPPERVAELGAAILADPELEQVDRAAAIEGWMASVIAASPPHSDPLIEPAVRRFGWDRTGRGWRRDYDLEQVRARREDLAFVSRCRRVGHIHYKAVAALEGPPPERLGLRGVALSGDIRVFLREVEAEHPSAVHNFDPETLDWWKRYFEGPHLSPRFWLWLLVAPPSLTFLALLFEASQGTRLPIVAVYAGSVLLTLLALFAAVPVGARLRRWKARRLEIASADAPPPRLGLYTAAALALPLAAALLPTHQATLILFWAGAAWAASGPLLQPWMARTSLYDESSRPRVFMPAVAGVASFFLVIGLPTLPGWELAAPLAAMCLLGAKWHDAVRERLLALGPAMRLRLLGGALLLCVAASAATVLAMLGWPAWRALPVVVPVAIVAAHLATSAAEADPHGAEWPLRGVLALLYFSTNSAWPGGFAEGGLILAAAYGLGYALIRLIAALREAL
jgi:hypothetical protein